MKSKTIILLFTFALAMTGCGNQEPSSETLPEPNDQTCTKEFEKTIKDPALRDEFADRCFRRGSYHFEGGKAWK